MFSFDRLKIDQIPIWENEHRVEYLTLFRDLVYDRNPAVSKQLRAPLSPSTGQPLDPEQRRIEINERRSIAQRMIALAGIKTRRVCVFRRGEPEPPPSEIDVIDQLWDLEWLGVSFRQPAETIEEAIGAYKYDQKKARGRTRNPFFWAARILESQAGVIVTIGHNGKPVYHCGLVERGAKVPSTNGEESSSPEEEKEDLSAALLQDLTTQRTAALRAAL